MKAKVLGIGGTYSGEYQGVKYEKFKLYVDKGVTPRDGEGTELDVLSIDSRFKSASLHVGVNVNIEYNRYGRVDSIEVLNK